MRRGRVPLALSAVGLLVAGCSSPQGLAASSPPPIPAASGTLSPAQAMAAERAVTLFLSATSHGDVARVAQAVAPGQRGCFATLQRAYKLTVTSLRIVSARPAGPGRATVILRLHGRFEMAGHITPVGPGGPGHAQWLATSSINGRWYVDPRHSIAGNNLSLPLPCLGT